VSVAIGKIEGVEAVKVSLNQGWADVRLAPGNKVSLGRLRDVVRDNGFTPKDARVKLKGRLVERGGRPALELTGSGVVYSLSAAAGRTLGDVPNDAFGEDVLVEGRVPETTKRDAEPATLQIDSLARE
jgi:hypothetical protein